MLIDTHTHLDSFARRGALETTLERARQAGVGEMITIGTCSEDWTPYRDLTRAHPGCIHYTVGLHPCSVAEGWEREVAALAGFWAEGGAHPRPVALGECGLDRFHLPKADPEGAERLLQLQRAAFATQLALAKEIGCPVVVHSRGAFTECIEMVDASGIDWGRVVFHCFAEGPDEMQQLVRRGGYGSFTGILTYKNAEAVRAAARTQGLGRLMLETDAPYLTPMPHRGKPNEPAYVRHTAEVAADLFGISLDDLAATTSATARAFFKLSAVPDRRG
jgi:TatD DNase family protein